MGEQDGGRGGVEGAGARGGVEGAGARRVLVGGPWFEDLSVGQVFEAPAVTLTEGHAAAYQALFGDRLRLPLDATLSQVVTGRAAPLAHPMLVCNLAIGQSTAVSQRVRANLFYRGLVHLRPVHLGDTLQTRTEVVGLRQTTPRPGRPPTGLVALRTRTENQQGEMVLDFWRCPMIPLSDPDIRTGRDDAFDDIPAEPSLEQLLAAVPSSWRLDAFRARVPGRHLADLVPGTTYEVQEGDAVASATELVRLTLNLAAAHVDPRASPYGRRLVYGGHTISVAAAHAVRALPALVTPLAWRSCDHTAPVFEEDVLTTELVVEAVHPLEGGHGLADLRARVRAARAPGWDEQQDVLDWRFVGLMA